MPSGFESANNSPPSLISSLRNFRFTSKTQRYEPPDAQSSSSTSQISDVIIEDVAVPQVPDSTSFKSEINGAATLNSSNSAKNSINNHRYGYRKRPSATVTSTPAKTSQSYSPLYRRYDSTNSAQFLIPCITSKFILAIKSSSNQVKELQLKLTNEELNKIKELVLEDLSIAQKWKSNITHEDHSFNSPHEKVLKISKHYLKELLRFLRAKYDTLISSSVIEKPPASSPIRTYSRQNKTPNPSPVTVPNILEVTLDNDQPDLNQLESNQGKGIMDQYEVFCSKEQNLRKLLDAFPGADIMEAQDILVKCNWNLKKAMTDANKLPLRCTKKRPLPVSTSPVPSMTPPTHTGQPVNSRRSSSCTNSSATEEIVLDSSDEDTIQPKILNNKNNSRGNHSSAPAAKRTRVLSSSDTDEDTLPAYENSSLTVTPSNATAAKPILKSQSKPSVVNSNNHRTVSSQSSASTSIKGPAPAQSRASIVSANNKDETLKMSQSMSIRAVPSSTSTSVANSNTVKTSTAPMPSLPKGLVITQTNNSGSQPGANQPVEASATPKYSRIVNHNKSAQLVRIKSSNSTSSDASDSASKSNSLSVTPVSKAVSITPVSKGVSITPMGKSSSTVTTSVSDQGEGSARPQREAKSKRKKYTYEDEDDEEYGNDLIYDSDDSDFEPSNLTPAHMAVLKFFQESGIEELLCIPGCSKKKVDSVVNLRPFKSWADLVEKLGNDKYLSTDLLNGAKKVLDMRNVINKLMTKCQQISMDMEDLVENLKTNKETSTDYVSKQPTLLNDKMKLTSYQMLGLNWLLLMHNQEVNGILADEMGLGKTVQSVAFLAYLKEISNAGPHLIVVPSSTMDNWKHEFKAWWPDVSMICYHGSQDSRRELRYQILNDEVDDFDIMVTTYNMVTSSAEDRGFFKRLEFQYVVFDEAHMLKNMSSQRYQHLMKVKAPRRLLLTGTPLQNNLVELMSLLIFAMPHMFSGKTDHVKQMFSAVSKTEGNKNTYEKDRIDHAKRIMKPFVLRRLKKDVLQDLPPKTDEIRMCPMTDYQEEKYKELVETFTKEVESNKEKDSSSSGAGMMMQLRRAANHPLLLKRIYNDGKLTKMSKAILKEPTHCEANSDLVFEDMSVMSDFELHKLCKTYKSLKSHALPNKEILNSGKFKVFDELLPTMINEGHRILLFSQFTMVLDIVEDYMNIKDYKFLRLDGQVPVSERQELIDKFNTDPTIFIFLLSTRAGGLGINLTAADTVILHDIDFNPYNDKQAEDRCHRVGQTKDVNVIRLISENTIEEGILQRAKEKLKLERDIHEIDADDETEENDVASVAKLLRDALNLKSNKS